MQKTILLFIIAALPFFGFSQITISNTSEIAQIKTGTTFFAMKDPASPKAAAFVDAIKKNWTLSKVECIKYTDVEKNIAPNNAFVTIGANMTSSSTATQTNFSLEFWTTNGQFVYDPKKRKHFNQDDKILLASIALFPDYTTQFNPSSVYKMDYDASGHLKNWSPGILANYLQQISQLLTKAEERQAKTEFYDASELGKLGTLYFPDYVLVKFNKNDEDQSKKYDEKEVTEGLSFGCKSLATEELSEKILTSETAFYYLLLIKTNNEKWITVTNSKTGEIVYSTRSGSANFKPGDLKDLQKAIQKK